MWISVVKDAKPVFHWIFHVSLLGIYITQHYSAPRYEKSEKSDAIEFLKEIAFDEKIPNERLWNPAQKHSERNIFDLWWAFSPEILLIDSYGLWSAPPSEEH